MNGALLINKPAGITSYGVVDEMKVLLRGQGGFKKLPKIGHGGTLDPFATGLLVVLFGKSCKLARYFLGGTKSYRGKIRLGETTAAGDGTGEIIETGTVPKATPEFLSQLENLAKSFTQQAYLQTPPMFSAKKHQGKPLYELARAGVEIEREPKLCHLYQFQIEGYEAPTIQFSLSCSSGTYVRTLAQDMARMLGTVGLLESLERTASGHFVSSRSQTLQEIKTAVQGGTPLNELPNWVPFDLLLDGFARAEISGDEADQLAHGSQRDLPNIVFRNQLAPQLATSDPGQEPIIEKSFVALYQSSRLVAVAAQGNQGWRLDSVFLS